MGVRGPESFMGGASKELGLTRQRSGQGPPSARGWEEGRAPKWAGGGKREQELKGVGLATRWVDLGRGGLRVRPSFQQLRLGEGEARLLFSCLDHHPPPLRAQEGWRQPRV